MLTTRKKANVIKNVQLHATDTGSPEVQIGILSRKIEELANHLKVHKKDNHSRRGLLKMVSDRRTHMGYIATKSSKRLKEIAAKVGLKA